MRPQLTNSNASCGSGSDEIYAEGDSPSYCAARLVPDCDSGRGAGAKLPHAIEQELVQAAFPLAKDRDASAKLGIDAQLMPFVSETMPTKLTIDVTPVFHPAAASDRAPGKCRARRPFVWMVGPYGRSVSAGRIWPDLRIPAYSNGSKQCTCAALSQPLQERPETRQGEQKGKWQRDEFGQGPSAKGVVRPRTGPADTIANHSAHDHCTKNDKHVPGIPLEPDPKLS